MRLPGYCRRCRRIRQVRVTSADIARASVRVHGRAVLMQGICATCEEQEDIERKRRNGLL
jgi:hypothetical protein